MIILLLFFRFYEIRQSQGIGNIYIMAPWSRAIIQKVNTIHVHLLYVTQYASIYYNANRKDGNLHT